VTNTDAMVGPAKRPVSLRDKSALGFIWFLLQSIGSKAASLLGQIALAWLLLEEDFGLIGLAYTVVTFTSLVQEFGVREVLNRRRRAFHMWSGPGFALSLTAGSVGGLLALAAAPLAAWIYDDARLIGLIAVLAVAGPLWSAAIVPRTRLEIDLRFGLLAQLMFGVTLGTVLCSIALAALGAGAYAFVLPRVIVGAAQLAVLWRLSPISLKGAMRVRRWRLLVGDSSFVFMAQLFRNAFSQGDYFLLGLTVSKAVVGLYFLAFSLSMQTAVLFSQNLAKVLLPSLSVLRRNPGRQNEVAVEAFELLAFVTTPVCLLQAVLAAPGIRLLFAERWQDAIPLLQILSVGMAMTASAWPVNNLFDAQGRFRARMWFMAGAAGVFFALVAPAAFLYGVEGVAIAVVLHRALFTPAQLIVALHGIKPGLRAFWRVNGRPLLIAGAAAACAVGANSLFPEGAVWDGVRLLVGTATLGLVYAGLGWLFMRGCYHAIWERLTAIAPPLGRWTSEPAAL